MILDITSPAVFSEEYFFGVVLVVAAVVNLVLACMLLIDFKNNIYAEAPCYLRSRRLTSCALMVFGLGFLLHWWFMPHFSDLLTAKALSFSYFHIGGVLLSMSHTGLIDRHYLTRRVVARDIIILLISLCVYWTNAWLDSTALTYIGSGMFLLHMGHLTGAFYNRFRRIRKQLGSYADYMPNDTDLEVKWLHNSCHLIIAFGIGGVVCTVLFHDTTWPFTILLLASIVVFAYIYKALDYFGAVASEAEGNLRGSEEYIAAAKSDGTDKNEGDQPSVSPVASIDDTRERIEQWVAEKHYSDSQLTISDALRQMDVTDSALNYYLEQQAANQGYRQWISTLRIEEAKRLLRQHPDYSLEAIAKECGYACNSSLTRAFKTQVGMPPMEWLKNS